LTGSLSGTVHNAGKLVITSCTGFTSFGLYCNGIGNGVAYHISFDSTAPTTSVTASATSPICEGDSIAFAVGPLSSGMTFSWTGPGGFSSTLQNPRRYASLTAAGSYTVVTSIGSCRDTDIVNVVVKPKPSITSTSSSPVCVGDAIHLFASPFVPGETFSWAGPAGYTSALQNPVIASAALSHSGTYTVIANLNGCLDTATVNVAVNTGPAITATSNSPVCVGDSIKFTAGPSIAGQTFVWSGPSGFSSTAQNPIKTPSVLSDAGTYTVVTSIGSCSNTATVNVAVSATPVITATSNSPVCAGDSIKLTSGPSVAGQTFVWSGPTGFSSTAQNPIKTPSVLSDAGTYTVITAVGGCSDTAVVNMVVKPKPSITATGTTSVCLGDAINLFASPFIPGETFSWNGPAGYSSALQNPARSGAVLSYSGTYRVIVNLNGCQDTAVINVGVNIAPSITATSNSPVCAGDSIKFTAGPAVGGQTFAWSGPSAFLSTAQNPFRSPASVGHAGSYRVITAIGSCRDTAFVGVIVNPKPSLVVSATTPLCTGKTLLLTASPFSIGEIFSWTGPAGFASTLQNPVISSVAVSNSGVYTATATLNGCSAVVSVNVLVSPQPYISCSGNSPLCSGDNLSLNATSSVPGMLFQWTGPGSFTAAIPNPIVYNVTAANSGVYTIVGGANGCYDTSKVSIVVNPVPQITATGDSVLCEGQLLNLFAGPSAPGRTFLWSGPNYFSSTSQNVTISSVFAWAAGNYIVRALENGCAATDTVAVRVIDMGQYHSCDTTVCNDKPVSLLLSAGAPDNSKVLWSNGSNGNQIEITKPDTYWVKVSVSGCERVDTIKVNGESCICDAVMPNAFTPNGDDLNDTYGPIFMPGCFITEYSFSIYNRWGQMVFHSNHPKAKWDGVFLGVPAEFGVFMYYFSYSAGIEKTRYTGKGDVTLIR
jgi:gliding motility-associated-like protein